MTCLNPALDVTYEVPALVPGQVHRVASVRTRAGGKGTNVARVLDRLGAATVLVAPVGGATGAQFVTDLGTTAHLLVPIDAETRRSVAVVDGSGATVFNEAGPTLTAAQWGGIRAAVADALPGAAFAVLSGSVPPGAPEDAYAQLVADAHATGVTTLLDTAGVALTAALAARPSIVKVNEDEARAAVGGSDAAAAARALVAAGAGAAVVTRGGDGVLALVEGRWWSARPGASVPGNPTGAGDALAAALVRELASGAGWGQALAAAVAVSAASVATPYAGDVDPALAARLHEDVELREQEDA